VISWGGTFGATYSAVNEVRKSGKKVSLAHIRYINPMPKNLGEIIKGFKKVLVCELNLGQMKDVINSRYHCNAVGYNKVQGLPFKISELVTVINKELENTKLQ
jgi:2-oxoglutarate ferredoxin oxidoreductase subunit alpha